MSRHIITAGPKHDPLSELDIDELVERLTPGQFILLGFQTQTGNLHSKKKRIFTQIIDFALFDGKNELFWPQNGVARPTKIIKNG